MSQYYLINTQIIKNYLSELDKLDSKRTLCGLDLLIENIENNLLDILNDKKIMVELNNKKKEVTILGDNLPSQNWKIIFDKEKNSESIYNTFMFAIDYVRQTDGGEEMIKEIKSE